MKISLNWVFDHLDAQVGSIAVDELVARFNQTTAEIEGWHSLVLPLQDFALAQVVSIQGERIVVHIPEQIRDIVVPFRADVHSGDWLLVKCLEECFSWATMQDFGATKEGFIGPVVGDAQVAGGSWRNTINASDIILDIDNKSITHRPDLWGHRGIAREIGAMFDIALKSEQHFLASDIIIGKGSSPFRMMIDDTKLCTQLGTVYISQINSTPSVLSIAAKLLCIDARPINAVVDATNYAMYDFGYPMHAFDAAKLQGTELVVRLARHEEPLQMLDGDLLKLSTKDLVIADQNGAVSLAGIMGGASSGVGARTTSLLLEAGCFNPGRIRSTALHHKKRTEASARFEKGLDAQQVPHILSRCIALLKNAKVVSDDTYSIDLMEDISTTHTITITQIFIERRLGLSIPSEKIIEILTKIGFDVSMQGVSGDRIFTIVVPSFRATGDVTLAEDIVEEIGRFIGYGSIPHKLPLIQTTPSDTHSLVTLGSVRQLLSYGMSMHELYSYSFFDEIFLREIDFDPLHALEVANPVSSHWRRLVTSLVPHLVKAVVAEGQTSEELSFFEWGRVWNTGEDQKESTRLAGVFFSKKQPIDFYDAKSKLEQLFTMRNMKVQWNKIDQAPYPWFAPYTTALLTTNSGNLGYAGLVHNVWLNKVVEGSAFVFELYGELLLKDCDAAIQFESLARYPGVERDLSMLVPFAVTVANLEHVIQDIDSRIVWVKVVDLFHKEEWAEYRAVTCRFLVRDTTKTMTGNEVDDVQHKALKRLVALGVTVR